MSTTAEPVAKATQRLVFSRTVLEFELADGRTVRVPAPTRRQITRIAELEEASKMPTTPFDGSEPRKSLSDRFAKGPRRFAKGLGETCNDEFPGLEDLRAAQLAVLLEKSEPPLDVETLTVSEGEQLRWTIIAHHLGNDPAFAAQVCQITLFTGREAA